MSLIEAVRAYEPACEQEQADRETIARAIEGDPRAFGREAIAHVACSIWVVDPTAAHTLLVHHNLYRSWSWIGGHADGDRNLARVALRELAEETGIARARLVACGPKGRPTRSALDTAARALLDAEAPGPGEGACPPDDTPLFSLEVLTVNGHEKRGVYVGSHLHLNVTYLAVASPDDPIRPKPDENSGVRWVPLSDAVALSTEPWIRDRVYRKLIGKLAGR